MGKVIAVEYVTVDGVFEEPGLWSMPYFNEELAAFQGANMREADALLLGRRTYEGFKAVWPQVPDEHGGREMNSLPKWVATTTLTEPEWNATFIQGEVADAVAKLKTEPGTLLINGSATLLNYLTRQNLVHEFRIMVFPLVRGEGPKLWAEGTQVALQLNKTFRTATGVEVLTYVPA